MAYCDIIWRFVSYDYFFVFKQKTAYEMRISDWSSDVCSSDLDRLLQRFEDADGAVVIEVFVIIVIDLDHRRVGAGAHALDLGQREQPVGGGLALGHAAVLARRHHIVDRKSVV